VKFIEGIKNTGRSYLIFGSLIPLILVLWVGMFFLRPGHLQSGKALTFKAKASVAMTHGAHIIKRAHGIVVPTTPQHPNSTASGAKTSTGEFALKPSWSQDFSSMPNGPLSSSVWDYNLGNGGPDVPGWGNNEEEYYTSNLANVRVANGQLIIEAEQESDSTDPSFDYTSARIVTTPSLNFTYGKLDIVAKLPAGAGSWPALWMLPSGSRYAIWTPTTELDPNNYLKDGEIDIMEATGSIPGQVTSSAQSYDYYPGHNERMGIDQVNDDTTTFHDYELQWTPTSLQFLVDGVVYHTVTKSPTDDSDIWPYNQPYYLILNIAMGGTEGGSIDNSSGPWGMNIKSIDYYAYTGQ
jgi:beta-glucanase (GH16 family)